MLGKDSKAYYSTTAIGVTPATDTPADLTWVEVDIIRDATTNQEVGEADSSTRGTGGYKATESTLKDASIDLEIKWVSANAGMEALRDAYNNTTAIAMAFMDGAIATSGNQGLTANFAVTSFSRSEPLEGIVTVAITLKPSSVIAWYEVA
jgi:hypothetical protein